MLDAVKGKVAVAWVDNFNRLHYKVRRPDSRERSINGTAVAIIEAMKMQNIIRAERDGVVKSVGAKAGDSVAADEVLVEFA